MDSTGSPNDSWQDANRRHLGQLLSATFLAVESASQGGAATEASRERHEQALAAAEDTAASMASPPHADVLGEVFDLSPFELSVVLLCAGWELDRGKLSPWLGTGVGPTLGNAMALLPDAHWSASTPASPLRAFRLIDVDASGSLINSAIRIAEPVLHFLKGAPSASIEITRLSTPAPTPAPTPTPTPLPIPDHAGEVVARLLRRPSGPGPVQLVGDNWLTLAAGSTIGQAMGIPVRLFRAADLPTRREELDELRVLLARDVSLGALVPLFLVDRAAGRGGLDAVAHCIDPRLPIALIASPEPIRIDLPGLRAVSLPPRSHQDRLEHWRQCLGARADDLEPLLDRLVVQFRLDPQQVETACDAWFDASDEELPPEPAELWQACIEVATPQLDGLAERVPARDGFRDLVLPPAQREVLDSIVAQSRQRAVVDVRWGMQPPDSRGGGIAVLFSGPSGTGKTLAAEGLAWELRLPLFRVDLSSVVSKYIGETEKHLSKLFDAAEAGGSVLLFDEADALFGKRSEVSSAHDRYANIEVSYLLQRLESYSGLAILTTNHRSNIDEAFLRRVRFVVAFPTPGVRQRLALWQRVFPDRVPIADLDHDRLAEIELTGGSIRNAALVAASLAAEAQCAVGMPQVLRAVRLELAKQGKHLAIHSDEAR
ncbi:ATP-binding protein [Engelhardtia mirabilis]|uniref:ATP-binding protein n=1 Tax=Engelhardtia mirabilis TaxID=2528011 RepID=UPI003AF37FD8